jgi:PAS domain S-box-containing protein
MADATLPNTRSSRSSIHTPRSHGSLDADIIIANAPDPVFVADLAGKILQANDAVSELLGFRPDEVLEQSLSRFISPEETREFLAALDEVIERGVTRDARLSPRSASGEVIPTTMNASALRDADGKVIGAIGILRDMRELDKARAYAESLIKNAPDPVFVSDLEGKILLANDAVYALLGFRTDELIEQSLSRIISPEETREFLDALREVVEREEAKAHTDARDQSAEILRSNQRGVTRNARLNPRSASGESIPTTMNASALRDSDGKVIGAIGILRDMRAYEQVVRDLERSKAELQEKILDLEKFEEVVVGRELKMIALEKEIESLRRDLDLARTEGARSK